MSGNIARRNGSSRPPAADLAEVRPGLTEEQIDLIKATVARGASDVELDLFLYTARRTGLDPLSKQIYAIKRREQLDDGSWGERLTIQTGIDGFRLIADRTGRYCPGPRPTFTYDTDGNLLSAIAYVRKQTADGTWHTVEAEARYDEYVGTRKDGKPTKFWARMPHSQLAKCAESLALRRAFPQELSGIYTSEEMDQADDTPQVEVSRPGRQALPARPPRQSHPPHDSDEVGAMVDSISGATYTRLAKLVRDGHYTPDRFKVDFPHLKSTSQLTETEGVALVARIEADLALREEERQLAEEALREPGDDTEEGVLLA